MDLMKPVVVALAGWMNQQQEDGKVVCRERLGGLLRYYYRDEA